MFLKINMDKLSLDIRKAKKIVVICGAGISTGSGIQDFKDSYKKNPKLKEALSKSTFSNHFKELSRFLMSFYSVDPKPTKTHEFIYKLANIQKLLRCYTMNIDALEEKVGIPKHLVYQVHGGLNNGAKCAKKHISENDMQNIFQNTFRIKEFNTQNNCKIRPNIVLYGEPAKYMYEFKTDLKKCDLIICIGTRLNVDPIASIINEMNSSKKMYLINNEYVNSFKGTQVIGDCDQILSMFFTD